MGIIGNKEMGVIAMDNNKEFIEASEVVNADDREYADGNAFLLAIGSYGEHKFTVYAGSLQDALELLGNYCKDKEYTGMLSNYDTLAKFYEKQWDGMAGIDKDWFPVNGGEYYLIMPGYVKEVTL